MKKQTKQPSKKYNLQRIKTNIPGFDPAIEGGFVKNSLIMISGGPGSGKTIFGLQYIYNGALNNEPGLVVTFDENVESLKADASMFGWDFDQFEKKRQCFFLSFKPYESPNMQKEMATLISKYAIKRVVIDSVSIFSMSFKGDTFQLRTELYKLSRFLKELDCTVVMTAELDGEPPLDVTSGGGNLSREGLLEFVADSVITLHSAGLGGEADRAIRVVKMRRTNHRRDPIPMKIADKGMIVLK
ncbi:hypothetical protein J4211_01295 [Candidatus Woesearchaeota archaeon]|nr:hypothetical protein [Candidatus Woesearchaeota archaeon]